MASTYPVWGWGTESDEPRTADVAAARPFLEERLGFTLQEPEVPAPLAPLPPDRVGRRLPRSLAAVARSDPGDRARHGLGRSYRDVVRGVRGRPDAVPDAVLRPTDEAGVAAVLDWCSDTGVAVVPFGGGTSVVGGVEPALPDRAAGYGGVVSLDLRRLSGVREVDTTSLAARVAAGTSGPELERDLRVHGLTARFYPQSFERSTVGGWIVTRAAGHFATGPTHVDDLVESVRAVTPVGVWESRRLPASGAGPSPDRMLLGSEGTLGVVTEAWLRVRPRPDHRWSAVLAAPDLAAAARAVRALLHAGMQPAACRVVDAREAALTGLPTGGGAALVLGFESAGEPVGPVGERALAACADHGLRPAGPVSERGGGAGGRGDGRGGDGRSGDGRGGVGMWRDAFLRAPYLRDHLVLLGALVETFETATTWDRLDNLVAAVTEAVEDALRRVCGAGTVTCRLTHAYPDGAAPYFTVTAPARRGSELAQWAEVKAAATEALLAAGGTVTHHHAVGRDHAAWHARQMPAPFLAALGAARAAVDPAGILNPGVLAGR